MCNRRAKVRARQHGGWIEDEKEKGDFQWKEYTLSRKEAGGRIHSALCLVHPQRYVGQVYEKGNV